MFKSIKEMADYVKATGGQTVAVANAHSLPVLLSLQRAVLNRIVTPVLTGDGEKIKMLIERNSLKLKKARIINAGNDEEAAELAVRLVSSGQAQMLMKGLIATSTLLKAVLNKEWGLRNNSLLSHAAVFNLKGKFKRTIIVSDAAINIAPDLMQKKAILENSVHIAHKLGIKEPKVAVLCAVNTVNPDMQATIDAADLTKMNDKKEITGCVVDGPMAFDNIISPEAAEIKGISGKVAGKADIIIVPNIETGNVLYKALNFFATEFCAGIIAGAKAPIILTSRADTHDVKYNSIVLANLIAYSHL